VRLRSSTRRNSVEALVAGDEAPWGTDFRCRRPSARCRTVISVPVHSVLYSVNRGRRPRSARCLLPRDELGELLRAAVSMVAVGEFRRRVCPCRVDLSRPPAADVGDGREGFSGCGPRWKGRVRLPSLMPFSRCVVAVDGQSPGTGTTGSAGGTASRLQRPVPPGAGVSTGQGRREDRDGGAMSAENCIQRDQAGDRDAFSARRAHSGELRCMLRMIGSLRRMPRTSSRRRCFAACWRLEGFEGR